MRYLSLASLVVLAAAAAAFGCGDDDSIPNNSTPTAGDAGEAGAQPEAGKGGSATAGKGGGGSGGKAGSGAEAGEPETSQGGEAGEPSVAGGGGGLAGGGGTGGVSGGGTGGVSGGGTGGVAGAALGSLGITVTGVPTGSTASIGIVGPSNYATTISATSTLADLAAGSYTITPAPISVPGAQVNSVYDGAVTGSPAAVVLGAKSTAAVAYAKRPGTGTMWGTGATGHTIFSFDATAIAKTGTQTAAATVTQNLVNLGPVADNSATTQVLAFSAKGEMWVGTCKSGQAQVLAKYSPSKIATSGSPSADVTITLPVDSAGGNNTYDCVVGLAFDSAGNLWAGLNRGRLIEYKASDLAASGAPAPTVTLTSAYFSGLVDMAFDTAGNLYTASFNFGSIPRFSAAQLTATNAAVVPDVVITLGNTNAAPGGIALASDGSLWVADYNNGNATSSLFKYKAADLGATGTPTPTVTITGVQGPEQLAFDKAGNLWVASYDAGRFVEFSAADLLTSGAKTPLATLTANGDVTFAYSVRFNPGAF